MNFFRRVYISDLLTFFSLEIHTLDESWLAALYKELTKPYFLSLKEFLKNQQERKKKIFPPQKDIYSWSRLTPLNEVKVVVLGQDPYHNDNQAHGLAFSVNPPTVPPPSLKNIFKCLKNCYPDFQLPKIGLLTPWSKQGVLLLNTCLTVEAHQAFSHANKGWEQFTEKVLKVAVEHQKKGICFLAWGSPAGKRIDQIRPGSQHLVLKSVHPSPLSASRGFFTCEHFLKANEWLEARYGPEGIIDWALYPGNKLSKIELVKEKVKENTKPILETAVNTNTVMKQEKLATMEDKAIKEAEVTADGADESIHN